jgi:hypothetical protein
VGVSWTSESSDSDLEDLLYFNIGNIPERIPRPKIKNFLAVVHKYNTNEEIAQLCEITTQTYKIMHRKIKKKFSNRFFSG